MPAKQKKEKDMVKARMVILLQMFYYHTDQQHPMTGVEIMDYLKDHGAPANEKTLRGDIRLLQDLGIDIVKIVSRPNLYFWGERQFEMPELKLLIDAVSSSRFITQKKSKELVRKLGDLSSENQKKELRRNIQATNRIKPKNETIYYLVDTINEAITSRKKLQFKYTEYGPDLEEIYRNGGEVYELSPYGLLWNEDYYYVVGWSDKHENVSSFRADRLVDPEITEEKAVKKPDDFDIDDYSRRIFEMFDGEPTIVTLEVRNDFAKYIVDRFGTDLKTTKVSDDYFRVDVEVSLSPTFYAWVFRFGGEIRILSPDKAVEEMKEMAGVVK